MVFTFLKGRGLEVGSSLVEEDMVELAQKLEKMDEELISDAQSKVQGLEDVGRTAVAEQLQQDTSKVEQAAGGVISSLMKKIESAKKQVLTTSDGVRVKATEASEAQQARKTLASKDQRELEEVKNALEVKSESQVEGLKALQKDRAGEVES